MKKLFFKNSLLVLISVMLYSCSADSDALMPKNQDGSITNREVNEDGTTGNGIGPNVLTQEGDGNGGGGGGSNEGGCYVNDYSNITGNQNSGQVVGRIVANYGAPVFAVPYYIEFNISYSKDSQGNYVLVKNISNPKTNCSAFGQPTVTSNNCNAYYVGGHLIVVANFTVTYTLPKMGNTGGYDIYDILYSKSNTFTLP